MNQDQFDMMIGRLDRILSEMVRHGKQVRDYQKPIDDPTGSCKCDLDDANIQTLKHHAEDMILAGHKIMKDLGYEEETPILEVRISRDQFRKMRKFSHHPTDEGQMSDLSPG